MTNFKNSSHPVLVSFSGPLFEEAVTHSSLEEDKSFERLEFLGDSLIEACVSQMLFKMYPMTDEGRLSRWRSVLVNQKTLSSISDDLELSVKLRAKADQIEALKKNERIKASLFESLCGALFLKKGIGECFSFIEALIKPFLENIEDLFEESDPKTSLQEWTQKHLKVAPKYKKEDAKGPSHKPVFTVSVWVNDLLISTAESGSLKESEKKAAHKALALLKNNQTLKNNKTLKENETLKIKSALKTNNQNSIR